jgi:glycosyltransferase involved in cell wall biosynthesis
VARIGSCKINVLFMQSQDYFGADSMIHGLIMQHLDRDRFTVHVACNPGAETRPGPALRALEPIEDLQVRPTEFGPTAHGRARTQLARDAVRLGPRAAGDLARLATYARRHRVDVVHGTEKPRDAFYGLMVARAAGARAVVHLHVKVEDWMSPLTRWAMRRADGLVGVSRFVADSAVAMGHDPCRVHAVLNALALPDDTVAHEEAEASVRAEFSVPDGVPLLLVASRLFPWKGHGDLLRALAVVRRAGCLFRLLVVGEDDPRATPGGGSYTTELQQLRDELGLTDAVLFTGFRSDVPRLMQACDAFVMPSFEEPFGVVYLEAMAASKPVVALDNGGTREVVRHGRTGLLSPPGDIPALAAHIQELLADRRRRDSMGRAGRRRLEAEFLPGRLADDMATVYEELAAR